MSLLRARFKQPTADYRPIIWPIKYPYWCSGTGDGYAILVAYVDSVEHLKEMWPEAMDIKTDDVSEITFTSRFRQPEWYTPPDQIHSVKENL